MMTDKVKASYFMIFVVMWEFFSYFGMQALLILYLTRKLHFSDIKAYAIYGAFSSLIFLTPILGGYVADRYCGYRYAVFWGCVLMIAGHLTLGLNETGLYSGLSLLILGMGLFKSNAICLIADCYADDQAAKSSALLWYYVSGNFGAILSQLLCPYLARAINWQTGFMLAAAGMALGLILFIYSIKYFSWHKSTAHPMWTSLNRSSQTGISLLSLSVGFFAIFFILKKLMVGDLLIVVSFIAAATFYAIYEQANTEQKQSLKKVVLLTIFATGFWIFDQQGSSSISLFIFRYIDRSLGHFLIPTGSFQAINPAVVLIFGSIMAFGWKYLAQNTIKPSPISKLSIGLLLLSLGFFFIAKAAALASPHHLSSMFYPFIGLVLIGCAEIFVDPVLLASITDAAPKHSESRLIALYYLAVGAIANYLAAKVADLTVDPTQAQATAATYHQAYMQILLISFSLFLLLALWAAARKLKINLWHEA